MIWELYKAKKLGYTDDLFYTVLGRKLGGGSSYIIETLSGTSPLSIVDALQRQIMSLIQYGKCVQDATPTPTSPVPIKINNGMLKMVDDELPSGYKRIKSIDFDGDFWYDTGKKLLGTDNVTMTLDNTASGGQNVFGSYNGTGSGTKNFSLYLYGGGSSSNCYLRYGSQLVRPRYGDGEKTITFGKDGTSGFTTNVTVNEDAFETEATAYIGMLPNSSSPAYTGKIVGDIFIGNRLRYIPCENPSGVIGYYEIKGGTFIEPVGTGTPIAGDYDHSHDKVLIVDGTPEVLSVASQIASVENLYGITNFTDEQNVISGLVTRRMGVKIFDGTETWTSATYGWISDDAITDHYGENTFAVICTHAVGTTDTPTEGKVRVYHTSGGTPRVYFYADKSVYDTASAWQAFVASQYAAGTPIMIVYPLAQSASESVTAQPLSLEAGNNTLTATAEVSGIVFDVEYKQAQ